MNTCAATAVVVTYRSAGTIEDCLGALRRCRDAGLCETVVVDNASPDGTRDLLRAHENWARVVDAGGNLGFGRGCNRGLAEVRTPFVVFVNPDAVIEPDALRTLLSFANSHPRAGIVAPAIREPDGSLQHAGGLPTPASVVMGSWPGFTERARRAIEPGSRARRVDWVCGALLLSRTELLRSLGGFDPRFFLYWEETDLCRRVLAAGHEIWAVGEALATHVGGASALPDPRQPRWGGSIPRHYFQSRFYYLRKHHGVLTAGVVEFAELLLLAVNALRWRTLAQFRARRAGAFFSSPPDPQA